MSLLIIAIIVVIVLLLVYFLVIAPMQVTPPVKTVAQPLQVIKPSPKATPWACYDGINSPMRKNASGEVECMSVNAKDCMWKDSREDCMATLNHPAESIKPLVCGDMHKAIYGTSGYDNPEHWCSKMKTNIPFT